MPLLTNVTLENSTKLKIQLGNTLRSRKPAAVILAVIENGKCGNVHLEALLFEADVK